MSTKSTLVGVMLDVSESMRSSFQIDYDTKTESGTRFTKTLNSVMNKLTEEDQSSEAERFQYFCIAFGLLNQPYCDIVWLLECTLHRLRIFEDLFVSNPEGWELMVKLLETNGAPYVRDYAKKYLDEDTARYGYQILRNDEALLWKIVDALPRPCKWRAVDAVYGKAMSGAGILHSYTGIGISALSSDNEKEAAEKVKNILYDYIHERINNRVDQKYENIFSRNINIHSLEKIKELWKQWKVFRDSGPAFLRKKLNFETKLYGNTPMRETLQKAQRLFSSSECQQKVLFLISDGQSTDGSPVDLAQQMAESKVTFVGLFLSEKNITGSRKLYYSPNYDWDEGACTLFSMCSIVPNSTVGLNVFIKEGWELPSEGECRVFVQTNHPDVIESLTTAVTRIFESTDALLDIIDDVTVDQTISAYINSFEPSDQKQESTCYAHACAFVICVAMRRINYRNGDYPNFTQVKSVLQEGDTGKGKVTKKVLEEYLPRYDLEFRQVNELNARKALNERRPVVARFQVRKALEWANFCHFYENDDNRKALPRERRPVRILDTSTLQSGGGGSELRSGRDRNELIAHSVVLVRCNANSLTFLNSWGQEWGDDGFFSIANADVLNVEFFDVFSTNVDLMKEKDDEHIRFENAALLVQQYLPFKEHLSSIPFDCPSCNGKSPIKEYSGTIFEAVCPLCNKTFKPTLKELLQCLYKRTF